MASKRPCPKCADSGLIAMGERQYLNCDCGAWSNLTPAEQEAQGARCACRGIDDWCPCQNTPDAETRRERAALTGGEDGLR